MCRCRRELSNEHVLAKIGVDTAENEPLEVWGKIQFTVHSCPSEVPSQFLVRQDEYVKAPERCKKLDSVAVPPLSSASSDVWLLSSLSSLRSEVNIELNFPPKLRGARSRLYRRRFLQVNTRWKALAEIYTMHSFAPFSNLNFSSKIAKTFSLVN